MTAKSQKRATAIRRTMTRALADAVLSGRTMSPGERGFVWETLLAAAEYGIPGFLRAEATKDQDKDALRRGIAFVLHVALLRLGVPEGIVAKPRAMSPHVSKLAELLEVEPKTVKRALTLNRAHATAFGYHTAYLYAFPAHRETLLGDTCERFGKRGPAVLRWLAGLPWHPSPLSPGWRDRSAWPAASK